MERTLEGCAKRKKPADMVVDLEEDKEQEEKEKEEEAATFEKVAAEKDAVLKREEDYIAAIKSLEKELVFLKRELQRSEDACSSLLLQFEIQSESYRDLSSVIKQLKDLGMEKDAMKKKLLPEKSKEDHVEKEDTTIDEESVVEESLHDHSSGVEAEAVREEQDRRVYDLQARLREAENQVEYFRNASLKESSELRLEIVKRQQTYSQGIHQLGGQAKTLVFVMVNPELESFSETLNTLNFAKGLSAVELGAAQRNREGTGRRELMEQLKLMTEDGVQENLLPTEHQEKSKVRSMLPRPPLSLRNHVPSLTKGGPPKKSSNQSGVKGSPSWSTRHPIAELKTATRPHPHHGEAEQCSDN